MTEEKLVKEQKNCKELNEQWERIVNQRVEEIRLEAEEKNKSYRSIIKKLQNELKVLRGCFKHIVSRTSRRPQSSFVGESFLAFFKNYYILFSI